MGTIKILLESTLFSALSYAWTSMSQYSHSYNLVMSYFLKKGTSINFGIYDLSTESKLLLTIEDLISNYKQRKDMSKKGKKLIDHYGAERITTAMMHIKHTLF